MDITPLNEHAVIPRRANADDAGFDLTASEAVVLRPGERALVPTALAIALPPGTVGLVCPRSSLAGRHGVTVLNAPGVVDAGYRGEWKVILVNHGTDAFTIERGDRIAQVVIVSCLAPDIQVTDELDETPRRSWVREHRAMTDSALARFARGISDIYHGTRRAQGPLDKVRVGLLEYSVFSIERDSTQDGSSDVSLEIDIVNVGNRPTRVPPVEVWLKDGRRTHRGGVASTGADDLNPGMELRAMVHSRVVDDAALDTVALRLGWEPTDSRVIVFPLGAVEAAPQGD